MGKKDILALLNLVYRLVIHILKKPVSRIKGHRGYNAFVSQYRGLTPVSAAARALYPSLSGCIDCGICIAECSEIRHEVPPVYLFVSYSRLLPELFYSDRLLKACMDCDTCLLHCPTGLQMKQLAVLYRGMVD